MKKMKEREWNLFKFLVDVFKDEKKIPKVKCNFLGSGCGMEWKTREYMQRRSLCVYVRGRKRHRMKGMFGVERVGCFYFSYRATEKKMRGRKQEREGKKMRLRRKWSKRSRGKESRILSTQICTHLTLAPLFLIPQKYSSSFFLSFVGENWVFFQRNLHSNSRDIIWERKRKKHRCMQFKTNEHLKLTRASFPSSSSSSSSSFSHPRFVTHCFITREKLIVFLAFDFLCLTLALFFLCII